MYARALFLALALAAPAAPYDVSAWEASVFAGAERLGPLGSRTEQDIRLMYVNTSKPFVACFAPKTGCTLWKSLVKYVNTGVNDFGSMERHPGIAHNAATFRHSLSVRAFPLAAYANAERVLVARRVEIKFKVARNPYDRFLSSYFDWRARVNAAQVSFAQFADRYEQGVFHGTHLSHTAPVSNYCDYEDVGYVVLRIEEMDLWFDTVLRRYDLDRFVRNLEPGQFYAPTLDNTTTVLDRAREVLRLQGWIGEVQRTAHARDSADKRFDYYTPALAKRVCRLQARDFTNFGYPCWDGIKDTFRIL